MTTILAPAESLARVHGRSLVLSILEKEILLTRIKVLHDGRFIAETQDWNSYWEPLRKLRNEAIEDSLGVLHSAWRDYLRSGFGALLRRVFCYRYFSLLDVLLSNCRETIASQSWDPALQAVLGFECFGITPAASASEVIGAGTCTLRNPCYLLAKLRMPDVLDDPQFLPLITVAGTEKPELYYHYRQYSLSRDSAMSLLFYPAVSEANRSASFSLINTLAGGVSYAIDPRARERAKRLCRGIVRPILQARNSTASETTWLEFIDVGAGSGSLTSTLCRQIRVLGASHGLTLRFRLWFVDLEPADPARFFRTKRLRDLIDSLSYLGDDYRNWLSKPQPLPVANGLRIALVSRLFNNLSRFYIRRFSRDDLPQFLGKVALTLDSDAHSPALCLATSGKGVESLVVSNARVPLPEGRTFAQLSLSEFYRGLHFISTPPSDVEFLEGGPFLPVRTFNLECLVTSDDKSVIASLIENCDYVIIEDADLRPQDIIKHVMMFSLWFISIQDVTKALGLTGNHAYVLWHKTEAVVPDFPGKRIW